MPDSLRYGASVETRDGSDASILGLTLGSRTGTDVGGRLGLKYGGVLIAGIGFVLTRFVVLTALQQQRMPVQFLLSGSIALVFGLAVIVLGIGLAASTLPRESVNTIAKWCLVGVVGMAVVTGMGVLEALLYGQFGSAVDVLTNSQSTNGLIGGAVGGILVGTYSVRTAEHRRELSLKVDQMTLLNRVIRDRVLNKANVIQASVEFLRTDDAAPGRIQAIAESADGLERAVEDVGFLARAGAGADLEPVDVGDVVERSIQRARESHPETTISYQRSAPDAVAVPGNDHLGHVFDGLLSRMADRSRDGSGGVSVALAAAERTVTARVTGQGTSLTEAERELLVDGTLPEYDDPSVGFDLPIVRLLVTRYGGELRLQEGHASTGIAVVLPRDDGRRREAVAGVDTGLDPGQFVDTTLASLGGGVGMGFVLWSLTDTLPAIGGLYGVQALATGWILHLFRSVVFGILFVAVLESLSFGRWRRTWGRVALGIGYGLLLWLVAAGVVMPVWLNAVGIESSIPRLTVPSLLGHVTWGALLGVLSGLLASRRRGGPERQRGGVGSPENR